MKKDKRKYKAGQKAYAQMPITVKSIDKESYTLTMVSSTQDPDRHGDVVIQAGWDLKPFTKNPVILNSHRYDDATEVIANATRSEIVGKGKKARLEQDWKFAVDENPKAKIIFDLYAGGFLHASSVGFIPKKFKENKDGSLDFWTIVEAELLEVSAVSVPANAMALAKSKGIDVDQLSIKENEDEETNDTDQELDEAPEDDEIEETDGEAVAPDSDDSKAGEETDKQDDKPNARDTDDEPEDKEEQPEIKPDEEIKSAISYKQKVVQAIANIESKEKRNLHKVARIIEQLIDGDQEIKALNKKTQEQIKKRKLNQAIRSLMQIK